MVYLRKANLYYKKVVIFAHKNLASDYLGSKKGILK